MPFSFSIFLNLYIRKKEKDRNKIHRIIHFEFNFQTEFPDSARSKDDYTRYTHGGSRRGNKRPVTIKIEEINVKSNASHERQKLGEIWCLIVLGKKNTSNSRVISWFNTFAPWCKFKSRTTRWMLTRKTAFVSAKVERIAPCANVWKPRFLLEQWSLYFCHFPWISPLWRRNFHSRAKNTLAYRAVGGESGTRKMIKDENNEKWQSSCGHRWSQYWKQYEYIVVHENTYVFTGIYIILTFF